MEPSPLTLVGGDDTATATFLVTVLDDVEYGALAATGEEAPRLARADAPAGARPARPVHA